MFFTQKDPQWEEEVVVGGGTIRYLFVLPIQQATRTQI
jgi:hypothetical protein